MWSQSWRPVWCSFLKHIKIVVSFGAQWKRWECGENAVLVIHLSVRGVTRAGALVKPLFFFIISSLLYPFVLFRILFIRLYFTFFFLSYSTVSYLPLSLASNQCDYIMIISWNYPSLPYRAHTPEIKLYYSPQLGTTQHQCGRGRVCVFCFALCMPW